MTKYPEYPVVVPDNAGKHARALRRLLERIPRGYLRYIECDRGWYPILAQLEKDLRALDPHFTVFQIKEKFGGLRFYYESKTQQGLADALVSAAEAAAWVTCEACGAAGSLCIKEGYWLKTLCGGCAATLGYVPKK